MIYFKIVYTRLFWFRRWPFDFFTFWLFRYFLTSFLIFWLFLTFFDFVMTFMIFLFDFRLDFLNYTWLFSWQFDFFYDFLKIHKRLFQVIYSSVKTRHSFVTSLNIKIYPKYFLDCCSKIKLCQHTRQFYILLSFKTFQIVWKKMSKWSMYQ